MHGGTEYDYVPLLIKSGLSWPESAVKWFPNVLRDAIFAENLIAKSPDESYLGILHQLSEQGS